MKKTVLWILSFLLTAFILVYQRTTGPTYPLRGSTTLDGNEISYKLLRSHETTHNYEINITSKNPDITGYVLYKRFNTQDALIRKPLQRKKDKLSSFLPKQPSAGKLEYRVILTHLGAELDLSGKNPVIIRFKDPVPGLIVIVHILVMFLALFFSTRAGLEALRADSNPRKLTLWTFIFLVLGGLIFGPLMQKFAFGAFWTGFPFGTDLTDNKTLIALIGWLIAMIAVFRKNKPARGWVLAASILMIVIYLIPHSLLGSELDYSTLENQEIQESGQLIRKHADFPQRGKSARIQSSLSSP